MQNKGILKRWILPEIGLNTGTIYKNIPVGNYPEIMPMDCNLNLYTNWITKDDKKSKHAKARSGNLPASLGSFIPSQRHPEQ